MFCTRCSLPFGTTAQGSVPGCTSLLVHVSAGSHLVDCGAERDGRCLPPRCRCQGHCYLAAAPQGCPAPASLGPQRVDGQSGQSQASPGGRGLGWAVDSRRSRAGQGLSSVMTAEPARLGAAGLLSPMLESLSAPLPLTGFVLHPATFFGSPASILTSFRSTANFFWAQIPGSFQVLPWTPMSVPGQLTTLASLPVVG